MLLQGAASGALSRPPSDEVYADLAPAPSSLDEVFAVGGPASIERALGYLQGGGDEGAFVARLLSMNNTRTIDEHSYKGAHAALAEADRVDGAWRHHLLAASRVYGPFGEAGENRAWELVMGA